MLNLYYSRADKQLNWKDMLGVGRTIVVVPDQATLQTERDILESLGVPGLIDIEAISFSRLGHRILTECGGVTKKYVDERGRHMLLAKIIAEHKEELKIFGRAAGKQAFVGMVAKLIGELKQFNTTPTELASFAQDENSILARKLSDLSMIFGHYEDEIKGKYIDTEDEITLYTSKINQAEIIKNSEIWIHGFDYYTPKTLGIIEELVKRAPNVNITLSLNHEVGSSHDQDLFAVGEKAAYRLEQLAAENGIKAKRIAIETVRTMPEDLSHLEKQLYAYPSIQYEKPSENVQIIECSNYYTEAETVAAKVISLVRDEGLRFKDIAVICNDMDIRGSILKRVFGKHGISFFMDEKRNIMHNRFTGFVVALLGVINRGYRYEEVFQLLKTEIVEGIDSETGELSPINDERLEDLENYALAHKIARGKWKKPFIYGGKDRYGNISEEAQATLAGINNTREIFMSFMQEFENAIKPCDSVRKKSTALYYFLRDYVRMPHKIETLVEELKERQQYEYALEMAQVWNVIVGTLGQAVELVGDMDVDLEVYTEMLITGFEAVEIGIIPSTMDQVIVGTLQRTRTGNIKALIVTGANDGVIPSGSSDSDLLHEHEKRVLLGEKEDLLKLDKLRAEEEQLAIYRMFTAPSEKLILTYSVSDIDGREARPSILVGRLRTLLPKIQVEKDIVSSGDDMELLITGQGSISYVVDRLRSALDGHHLSPSMALAYNWINSQSQIGGAKTSTIKEGLFYDNEAGKLAKEQVNALYSFTFSPSQLESFSRCAFAHLMRYGVKPQERRVFEIASPELGEIFHDALLRFSQESNDKDLWEEMTDESITTAKIHQIVDDIIQDYKEGILSEGLGDAYRVERIKRVCAKTARAVAVQVSRGIESFNQFYFEAMFGKSGIFPGIDVPLEDGRVASIEGRIDRIDVFNREGQSFVKIIDYKSGSESFDIEEAKIGWKLQLMLYLQAAMKGVASKKPNQEVLPAGVFYFGVGDPTVSIAEREKMQAEIQKSFKMDGVILHDDDVILAMDPKIERYSDIIPVVVSKNKDGFEGTSKSKKQLLAKEEFDQLMDTMEQLTEGLCKSVAEGQISINPKKVHHNKSACTYCQYKFICGIICIN